MISDEEASRLLLLELVQAAGSRLASVELLRDSDRFLLATAKHVHTKRRVLLSLAKPGFADRRAQLTAIADMLLACPGVGLGDVLDRFWPEDDVERWGCLATTWHEGSRSLLDLLIKTESESSVDLIDGYRQILEQVDAMHKAGYVHGDLSLSNVVVVGSRFHIVDFEYVTSEKFYVESGGAFFTGATSQPGRLAALTRGTYTIDDAKAWDRFALGRIAMDILSHANPYLHPSLTLFNQRALRLVAGLLMAGSIQEQDHALGLPREFYVENGFADLSKAVDAIGRLLNRDQVAGKVPELSQVPPAVVEAGLAQPVPFTSRVRRLVATPAMQQISNCQQLGLVGFIWPTASHTRLQHALGTFGMACSAVNALFADPQSPFFVVLMDAKLCRTFLAAALLHDVGHYPLAHDLEEAFPGPFDHEPRSVAFIESPPISEVLEREEAPDGYGWGVNSHDVASVIEGAPRAGAEIGPFLCGMLHSLLSGALDVDKLDYLIRDSRALGVRAGGGIDLQRVINSLTIVLVSVAARRSRSSVGLRLAVRAKGVRPAELVGRVRSHMFGVAYWHHSYRAIKSMIHWLVWTAVVETDDPGRHNKRGDAVARVLFESLSQSDVPVERQETLPGLGSREAAQTGGQDLPRLYRDLDLDSKIPGPESAVLELLDQLGRGKASEMRALLSERNWYRAVLTVEHYDNLAVSLGSESMDDGPLVKRIWELSDRLKSMTFDAQILIRRQLCIDVQNDLHRWFLDHIEEPNITRIVDWPNERDNFLVSAELSQLVLVDLVETRKSKDKPLYFVPSERPGSRMLDTARPIPVRQSFDQAQLQDEFIVSNGAIRVLVHPEFDRLVSDSIEPRVVLSILEGAMARNISPGRVRKRRTP